jgi:signal transduction histidine kinase
MTSDFRECEIWSRVFKNVDPKDVEKATRLKTSFIVFRERVKGILEKISSCLPNLTVHDITHIDALWDTAGLIVGSSYPLNPMEVYVLGGAILLHDAALCFDAYEGGLEGKAEHFAIVLRELLQNARDAIVARRNIEPEYAGKIRVLVNDVPATVEVLDDGVGMSHRVLTGPLLDFGSSFWKSDMVKLLIF